jgi:RNA polymerase sigma factor (sigma-70 family)
MSQRLSEVEAAELVTAAAAGDHRAWEGLVNAYVGLIWAIARNHGLSLGDAADVSQTTWLRLIENIDRLDDRSRVGAWLATTARRECLRILGLSRRQRLVAAPDDLADALVDESPAVDAELLAREQDEHVRQALRRLSRPCQELLHLLMLDPPPSYQEISAALGIPVGSIGPNRGRCLRRLQQLLAEAGDATATGTREQTANHGPAAQR